MSARKRGLVAALGALAVAALLAGGYVWGAHERGDREEQVAARGARVMPFDLERTTHVFRKRADGGVQTVVADDSGDVEEVEKIREHLRGEAAAFRRGDFGDPAQVHGHEMPGLPKLEAGAERIEISYADIAAGGRIRYATGDPALVAALHAWFEAQVEDHGRHATMSR